MRRGCSDAAGAMEIGESDGNPREQQGEVVRVTKRRRAMALGLLIAALALAVLGQFYFVRRQEYLWDGLVFSGLAALCFILAWRMATARPRGGASTPRRPLPFAVWVRQHHVAAALLALGLLLSTLATLLSRNRAWNQSTYDVVILWLSGVGTVVVAAFWPASFPAPIPLLRRGIVMLRAVSQNDGSEPVTTLLEGHKSRLRSVSREVWLEVASVVGLTVLAFLLRGTALGSVPYTLGGDEAWHGLLARQVVNGELRNPFVMGTMSMPTLFYWPLSWSLRLMGDNMVGVRLLAALAGTATVPILYLLARSLWGRRMGLVSATFLTTYDYHIHYSRLGANNVWDPLLVVLALWLVERGIATNSTNYAKGTLPGEHALSLASGGSRRARCFILAGLVMGLGVYFYTGARLLPSLVVIYLGFYWLGKRLRRVPEAKDGRLWPHLLLLVLAFLVMAGPMLSFALAHPDEWNARLNQVGILQSGWLAREPGLTGKGTAQILAEQFLRAAGAFHVFRDRAVWYGADRPLLGFGAGVFAILGMAWAAAHARDRRYFLVLLWFWSVIVTGGMLTESPPSSQRLVMAIPAVVLLVVMGLEQSVRLAGRLFDVNRRRRHLALGLLTLALAVSSVRFYFVEFTPSGRYGSENGETATMIGHYLNQLDGGTHAYFFGAPRIYWSFGSMSFLAPGVMGQDVIEPLPSTARSEGRQAPPDFVDRSYAAVFVLLPERAGELAWVQQSLPDGRLREFRDVGGQLRFIAYEVRSIP